MVATCPFKDESAISSMLNASRQEMYNALSLFHTHVKHTVSLMLTIMTAVFAVLGFSLKETSASPVLLSTFRIIGGILLISLFPLGLISILIIARYYKLYVAALLYASELHESVDLCTHAWFEHLKKDLKSVPENGGKEALLKKRTYGWPHSWILYSILIVVLSLLSLLGGFMVLYKL